MIRHNFVYFSSAAAAIVFVLCVSVKPARGSAQLTPSFSSYAHEQAQPFLVEYNGRRCIVRIRKRISGVPPQRIDTSVQNNQQQQQPELAASSSNLSPQYAKLNLQVIANADQVANVLNDFQSSTTSPPPSPPTSPSGPTTPYHYSYRTRPLLFTPSTTQTPDSQALTDSENSEQQQSQTQNTAQENRYKNWWTQYQNTHDVSETGDDSYQLHEQHQHFATNAQVTPERQSSSSTSPPQSTRAQTSSSINTPAPRQFIRLSQASSPTTARTSVTPPPTFGTTTPTSSSAAPTKTSQRILFTETTAATTTPASLEEPDSTPRHSFSWWLTKIPTQPPASTTAAPQTTAAASVAKYGFFSHREGSTNEASSTSATSAAKLNPDASQQVINIQLKTNSEAADSVPINRKLPTSTSQQQQQPELEAQDSLIFYSVVKPGQQPQQQQELPHFPAGLDFQQGKQQPQRQLFTTTTSQPAQQQQQLSAPQAPDSALQIEIQPSRQASPTFNQFEQQQQSTSTTSEPQPTQTTYASSTSASLRDADVERQKYQAQIYRQKMFKIAAFREYFSTTTTTTTAEPTTTTSTETPTTWAPPPINELVRTTWQEFLEHEAPGTLTPDEVKRVVAAQGNLTMHAQDGSVRVDPSGTFASDPFLCRSKKRYVKGPIPWRSCNSSEPYLEISDLVVYKDAGIPIDECVTDQIPNGDRCATLQNGVARCVQKYAHYGLIGKDESGRKKHFCFEFPAGCQCQIVKYETVTKSATNPGSSSLTPRIPATKNSTITIKVQNLKV